MMDREYMEDVDTMTEEKDGDTLNPDYDRVSGSGEMPSLDEFLGVNHSSDGLGASSDAFGNVIGDPLYSDDSMGGFSASTEDGFSTSYDTDAGYDGNAEGSDEDNEVIEEEQDVKFGIKSLLNGTYLGSRNFKRNIPYFSLLVFFVILNVANRNYAEGLIRDEIRLSQDVRDLRAESIIIAGKLMSESKVTVVSKVVETKKLGIHEAKEPPMLFVMDKFHRADSLLKADSVKPLNNDDYYGIQN